MRLLAHSLVSLFFGRVRNTSQYMGHSCVLQITYFVYIRSIPSLSLCLGGVQLGCYQLQENFPICIRQHVLNVESGRCPFLLSSHYMCCVFQVWFTLTRPFSKIQGLVLFLCCVWRLSAVSVTYFFVNHLVDSIHVYWVVLKYRVYLESILYFTTLYCSSIEI